MGHCQVSVFKKTVAPLTLEERAAGASATAASAISIFEVAAGDLERAADELDAIRDEAAVEAQRHFDIKVDAHNAAYEHRKQAQKIRDLVGGGE